uniref:RING-type E3 ubiquitin transferase n=1 Tax=Erythrolobus madagascarensis TaxID=708628 RepID=A0A7S0T6Q5_9RHOD|mmetsp:Transcript_1113/g.2179  ORF Transcript_1113/g.2179 Transcript_1113/m.2179 type:complete len:325 (+) Transcript_1113:177-1151(+)
MLVARQCWRLAVVPFVIVVMVLCALCVLSWIRVAEQKSYASFNEIQGCEIISSSASRKPDGTVNEFRSEFHLRLPTNSGTANKIALRYVSGVYNVTEAEALVFNEQFPDGSTTTCYQNALDASLVSIVPVTDWEAPSDYVPTAIVITFFCGLATLVLIASLLLMIFSKGSPDTNAEDNATNPSDIESADRERERAEVTSRKTRGDVLARDEIYAIVDTFQVQPPNDPDACVEWTCSVCLEDYSSEHKRLVKLPCDHQYHRICLRKWLKRGGQTCCLCNVPLRTFLPNEATANDGSRQRSHEQQHNTPQYRSETGAREENADDAV